MNHGSPGIEDTPVTQEMPRHAHWIRRLCSLGFKRRRDVLKERQFKDEERIFAPGRVVMAHIHEAEAGGPLRVQGQVIYREFQDS